ncbi:uncharacterized protein BX664DRAFT_50704 [Halteromyces radiatus]|uniref:uncharacterized protein n=1 Tax=Halteromyces radiatus TaxID=101107 RepID=UPI0022210515|nr:uncharacterized protein BX664DRAFT_50704 [Halteromyces radiatus]KAI8076332.1 hypothetical protein BX664DRAFT_50704 [Halteromyces radiatus]
MLRSLLDGIGISIKYSVERLLIESSGRSTDERTPFCQHLIPILKAFSGVTGLMDFTWCENGLLNNRLLSLCLPKPMIFRSLLDGVGVSVKDKVERLLIESSGKNPPPPAKKKC